MHTTAPEPGHPTAAEKSAFLATNGVVAQGAERTYGIPAAAILAMAAVEGGYGFTRTALFAKNAFGYEFGSSAAAGGQRRAQGGRIERRHEGRVGVYVAN